MNCFYRTFFPPPMTDSHDNKETDPKLSLGQRLTVVRAY